MNARLNITAINGTHGLVISEGTLRNEDLVARFMFALENVCGMNVQVIRDEFPESFATDGNVLPDADDVVSGELLDHLEDHLSAAAPEGTHFGAHEGDGACFGFWLND